MTSPAEKADISPESHILCPVNGRVRFCGMADKAYRFALHLFDISRAVEHIVRIDLCKIFKLVALKTSRPTVGVRAAPQEFLGAFMFRPAVDFMACQTSDPASVEGKSAINRPFRTEIDGMVILCILMTTFADRRRIGLQRELGRAFLCFTGLMTYNAIAVRVDICLNSPLLRPQKLLHVTGRENGRQQD